jgi:chromosome segregation ATPase
MVDSICEEIAEVDNFWFYSYYVAWDNVYQLQRGHKSQTEGLEKKVNGFEEQIKGLESQINDPESEVNKLKVKVEALDKLLANAKTETDSEKKRSLGALSRETTRHKNELDRVRNTH